MAGRPVKVVALKKLWVNIVVSKSFETSSVGFVCLSHATEVTTPFEEYLYFYKEIFCCLEFQVTRNSDFILQAVTGVFDLAVRVFANGPGDLGSIPGRVIPKTQKMVLDASLLNTQHYKVRIKGKVEQSREGVAPSPTPCSSYRKGSLRVTLDYGRQLYFTYLAHRLFEYWKYREMNTRALIHIQGRNPWGVVAKELDCDFVINELEFQSCYYVHLQIYTRGKGMNLLIPPAID